MLYFDESGYTGPDLVNSKQPYFSLASIRMTDEEIAQIKKDVSYCEWGKELHFKSMYKCCECSSRNNVPHQWYKSI